MCTCVLDFLNAMRYEGATHDTEFVERMLTCEYNPSAHYQHSKYTSVKARLRRLEQQ